MAGVAELREEYRRDAQVKRLFDLAMKLEGLPRHSSTHAAGVVIGDRELSELAPLYRDPRSDMLVTQYSMKYAEMASLVKFDFLGLKTLTVIAEAEAGLVVDADPERLRQALGAPDGPEERKQFRRWLANRVWASTEG